MTTTTPQDGNGTPTAEEVPVVAAPDTEATTAFEVRYKEMKVAKAEARAIQSELSVIANKIVALQKEAKDKDEELKRARAKVTGIKGGLDTLFANEMRNY